MMFWRSILYYLVLLLPSANTRDQTENIFNEMMDLQDVCPYSSFCGLNASSEFKYSTTYGPCCHSCSCKCDCGLHGNCCFNTLNVDNRPSEEETICRHSFDADPFKYQNLVRRVTYYKMVNKCHCSNETTKKYWMTCKEVLQDVEFAPVYSASTGKIYSNVQYAHCNGDFETIPWQRSIACEPLKIPYMPHFSKNVSEKGNWCLLYHIPPHEVNLDEAICFPDVVSKCNTTGVMKTRKPFWDFCEKFNATYIFQNLRFLKVYANVYCFMCNVNVQTFKSKEIQCETQATVVKNAFQIASLAIVLNYKDNDESKYSRHDHERQFCSRDTVRNSPFQNECRPFQCKMGQIFVNNRCGYFSSQWIGGLFAVMLRLTPVANDVFIPYSFFEGMDESKRHDRVARWIRRGQLKFWNFRVLYHLSINQNFVEYIVVKAVYPSSHVDPNFLNKSVEGALGRIWHIVVENLTYTFRVSFNEFIDYESVLPDAILSNRLNASFNEVYLPSIETCVENLTQLDYENLLFPVVPKLNGVQLNEGFFITELFFCDQVDLFPEEFVFFGCFKAIFFKVKNVILNKFRFVHKGEVTLAQSIDGETIPRKLYKETARICASEFQVSVASVVKGLAFGVFVAMSITMSIAYAI